MTMRSRFNRRKRWIVATTFAGFGAATTVMILGIQSIGALAAGLVVFSLASIYGYYFAFWCPQCGKNWGYFAMAGPFSFSVDQRVHHCPFCGCDIDREE